MSGKVVLVATPIGNLGDMSQRGLSELADADIIVCEDTRHSKKLFNHFAIKPKRLFSMHDQNEYEVSDELAALAKSGNTVAVVTDAGMPGISDPGARLVAACVELEVPVSVVPGPSAAVSALVLSGFDISRWVFEGFLPRKGAKRKEIIEEFKSQTRAVVVYESPNRVASTLSELADCLGNDRKVAIVRELTKVHEEIMRGSLGQLSVALAEDELKGECVLVIEGARPSDDTSDAELTELIENLIKEGNSVKSIVEKVVAQTGARKNRVTKLANEASRSSK